MNHVPAGVRVCTHIETRTVEGLRAPDDSSRNVLLYHSAKITHPNYCYYYFFSKKKNAFFTLYPHHLIDYRL